MFRTRLVGVFLLACTVLPGCGIFRGDGPGICNRCNDRRSGRVDAAPVGYPGGECGGAMIPPGGTPIYGAPIYGSETMPPLNNPRIPKAGIDERSGKQFELEGTSRSGPVLTIPAVGSKGQ